LIRTEASLEKGFVDPLHVHENAGVFPVQINPGVIASRGPYPEVPEHIVIRRSLKRLPNWIPLSGHMLQPQKTGLSPIRNPMSHDRLCGDPDWIISLANTHGLDRVVVPTKSAWDDSLRQRAVQRSRFSLDLQIIVCTESVS
jgi:hypothetical protein